MSSDLHLEQQMEDFEESMRQLKALEAATLVQQGHDRASAVSIVKGIHDGREDASAHEVIYDEDGFPEYLTGELQSPELPEDRKSLAQVKAIAKEIIHHFD